MCSSTRAPTSLGVGHDTTRTRTSLSRATIRGAVPDAGHKISSIDSLKSSLELTCGHVVASQFKYSRGSQLHGSVPPMPVLKWNPIAASVRHERDGSVSSGWPPK